MIPYEFSRFDIVVGHYMFCSDWHDGQSCPLYARLSRISRYFRPSPMGIDLGREDYEMARIVYENLCEKHGFEIPEQESEDEEDVID